MLEEFDDDQLLFTVELEAYEKKRTKPKRGQPEQMLISGEEDSINEHIGERQAGQGTGDRE